VKTWMGVVKTPIENYSLQTLRLRFFDVEAIIQSDSSKYIDLFQTMYRRFHADDAMASARTTTEFVVLTQPTNPWGQPVLLSNGEVRLLQSPSLLDGFVYENILRTAIAQVQSHFLVHAGVVSHQGQGIIVAGDAGHGKTTLILELVRRGFKFLSDEMAAIGRSDRQVYPFPRSLRIRPGTLERVGFSEAAVGATVWFNKLILDIEKIKPNSMSTHVPICHIVILRDPTDTHGLESDSDKRMLNVLVDHVDDALLAALHRIEGIANIQVMIQPGFVTLSFHSAFPTRMLPPIEAVCREHQVLILQVSKRPDRHPAFDASARMETIPLRQGVMELVRRFQGGCRSALLQNEFAGSSTRLFMELADLVSQAQCHQLYVGSLTEMADATSALVTG
jgi:hypothetical protein